MKRRMKNERGAALITVLVAVMIIFILLFEFQYNAAVERQLAYNDLRQTQAQYLAKACARLALLRVAIYGRVQYTMNGQTNPQLAAVKPYLELIWNLPLPAFPPSQAVLAKLSKADKDASEKTLEETSITEGSCTQVITTESSKINLNFLQVPEDQTSQGRNILATPGNQPQNLFQYVGGMLLNLINNFVRESENPTDEFGNIRPEEIVFNVMDWVSPGGASINGGDKDSFYESQNPPYKAKRGRFFTIDELKLVKGIDENLFRKMRPYVTVYSYDGKINLNSATNTMLKAIYPDFTDYDLNRISEEKEKVGFWASASQFVTFVTDTLGRSGFKTTYPDETKYPFDVGSQSFLIESVGTVSQGKNPIQKTLKIAVALSSGRGGQVNPSITDAGKCNSTPGHYWDNRAGAQTCRTKPRNKADCDYLAGGWRKNANNQDCCNLNGLPPICTTTQDKAKSSAASSLKVLTWTEG